MPEFARANAKKATWRPSWYEVKGPRGGASPQERRQSQTRDWCATISSSRGCHRHPLRLDPARLKLEKRLRGCEQFKLKPYNADNSYDQLSRRPVVGR